MKHLPSPDLRKADCPFTNTGINAGSTTSGPRVGGSVARGVAPDGQPLKVIRCDDFGAPVERVIPLYRVRKWAEA